MRREQTKDWRFIASVTVISIVAAALALSAFAAIGDSPKASASSDDRFFKVSDKAYVQPKAQEQKAEQESEEQEPVEQEPVVEPVEEAAPIEEYVEPVYNEPMSYLSDYGGDFKTNGVAYDDEGRSYSWYSEKVLTGEGLTDLNSNGRHVDDQGFIRDGEGYIAIASPSVSEKGQVIDTPFGEAKVYDVNPYGTSYDVYTSW